MKSDGMWQQQKKPTSTERLKKAISNFTQINKF